jgi:hypothetical protein
MTLLQPDCAFLLVEVDTMLLLLLLLLLRRWRLQRLRAAPDYPS